VLLQYEKSEAQTHYVEFAGRPHLMMSAEGWEEIAAGIEEWLERVLAANTGKRSTMTPGETRADPSSRGDGEDQWLRRTERGPEPPGPPSRIGSSAGGTFCLTKSPSRPRFSWLRMGPPSARWAWGSKTLSVAVSWIHAGACPPSNQAVDRRPA
jgi:hypothetical protein